MEIDPTLVQVAVRSGLFCSGGKVNKRLALWILWAHNFDITARIEPFICDENARLRSRLPLIGKERAMFNRRRFEQTDTLERHLSEEAKQLREAAELLPLGAVRHATLRRAQEAETGSHISESLRSPGSQPPK
jgi:hypothetical protein